MTKLKYAVIGKSLPHTLSPEIHREFGAERYDVKELRDVGELGGFVKSREYAGFNVTIPYKEDVMPFLDVVSPLAKAVGAVNTVVEEKGKLCGYNTDVGGMSGALEYAGINVENSTVLILGSGGTAKTAAFCAKSAGAKNVFIVSRSGDLNYGNCYDVDAQVLINTTPVGMMPEGFAAPVDLKEFKGLRGVFDCVYNPLETLLVRHARRSGIIAANGLFMLAEQARLSHNIFVQAARKNGCLLSDGCGKERDSASTPEALRLIEKNRKNIVLIGMAGSGKTAIGRELAARLERPFIDTDELIEKKEGKSVAEIFSHFGEAYFRNVEKAVIKEACSGLGRVISTGGGAVLDEQNRFYISANAVVALVHREENLLATEGRPLSDNLQKAKNLWLQRKDLYFSMQDVIIENNKTVGAAVENLLELL